MKTPSINTEFSVACKRLLDAKLIGPSVKHDSDFQRQIVWLVLVQNVFPELGVSPKKYSEGDKETQEMLNAARVAYDKAFADAWTLESSNCGRHLSAHGFFRSGEKEKELAAKVMV